MNTLFTNTTQVSKIAVGANNNVYVGIVNSIASGIRLAGLFHSKDGGKTWAMLDRPLVNRFSSIHFSIGTDARNPVVVYVGGQQQPSGRRSVSRRLNQGVGEPGRNDYRRWYSREHLRLTLIRAVWRLTPTATCSKWTTAESIGAPVRQNNTGDWYSIVGNLQITELLDLAFDPNSGVVFGGAQDNGAAIQIQYGKREMERGRGRAIAATSPLTSPAARQTRFATFELYSLLEALLRARLTVPSNALRSVR